MSPGHGEPRCVTGKTPAGCSTLPAARQLTRRRGSRVQQLCAQVLQSRLRRETGKGGREGEGGASGRRRGGWAPSTSRVGARCWYKLTPERVAPGTRESRLWCGISYSDAAAGCASPCPCCAAAADQSWLRRGGAARRTRLAQAAPLRAAAGQCPPAARSTCRLRRPCVWAMDGAVGRCAGAPVCVCAVRQLRNETRASCRRLYCCRYEIQRADSPPGLRGVRRGARGLLQRSNDRAAHRVELRHQRLIMRVEGRVGRRAAGRRRRGRRRAEQGRLSTWRQALQPPSASGGGEVEAAGERVVRVDPIRALDLTRVHPAVHTRGRDGPPLPPACLHMSMSVSWRSKTRCSGQQRVSCSKLAAQSPDRAAQGEPGGPATLMLTTHVDLEG